MDNQLKGFFQDHRDQFDSEEPSPKVWKNIHKELKPQREGFDKSFIWKAAAILLFALSSVLIIERQWSSNSASNDGVIVKSSEFQEAKGFYTSLIELKKQELEAFMDKNPALIESFHEDLAELNALYSVLEEEYKVTKSERIVDALIENLRIRIKVLDKQISILEQINNEKHQEDEYRI